MSRADPTCLWAAIRPWVIKAVKPPGHRALFSDRHVIWSALKRLSSRTFAGTPGFNAGIKALPFCWAWTCVALSLYCQQIMLYPEGRMCPRMEPTQKETEQREKDIQAPGAKWAQSQTSPRVLAVWAGKFILSVKPVWVGFTVTRSWRCFKIPSNCEAPDRQTWCFSLLCFPDCRLNCVNARVPKPALHESQVRMARGWGLGSLGAWTAIIWFHNCCL